MTADLKALSNGTPVGMVIYKMDASQSDGEPIGGFPSDTMAGCATSCLKYTWNTGSKSMVYSSGSWLDPERVRHHDRLGRRVRHHQPPLRDGSVRRRQVRPRQDRDAPRAAPERVLLTVRSHMRPGKFVRRHLQRRARNERGMVMAWFGIMLLVLMAFAGFGVDVGHWWYEGQREQQAADAAAHAGVVFLPADLAQAKLVARQEAAQNGFNDGIITNAPVNADDHGDPGAEPEPTPREDLPGRAVVLRATDRHRRPDHHPSGGRRVRGARCRWALPRTSWATIPTTGTTRSSG